MKKMQTRSAPLSVAMLVAMLLVLLAVVALAQSNDGVSPSTHSRRQLYRDYTKYKRSYGHSFGAVGSDDDLNAFERYEAHHYALQYARFIAEELPLVSRDTCGLTFTTGNGYAAVAPMSMGSIITDITCAEDPAVIWGRRYANITRQEGEQEEQEADNGADSEAEAEDLGGSTGMKASRYGNNYYGNTYTTNTYNTAGSAPYNSGSSGQTAPAVAPIPPADGERRVLNIGLPPIRSATDSSTGYACGQSCWAMAAADAIQIGMMSKGATPIQVSHTQIMICQTGDNNLAYSPCTCPRSMPQYGFDWVEKPFQGLLMEEDTVVNLVRGQQYGASKCLFPSSQITASYGISSYNTNGYLMVDWDWFKGEDQIWAALLNGPLVAHVDCTSDSQFIDYRSGVYWSTYGQYANQLWQLDHAVTVVGGSPTCSAGPNGCTLPCFYIRNNWGTSWWGESGNMRMMYGHGVAGIGAYSIQPLFDTTPHTTHLAIWESFELDPIPADNWNQYGYNYNGWTWNNGGLAKSGWQQAFRSSATSGAAKGSMWMYLQVHPVSSPSYPTSTASKSITFPEIFSGNPYVSGYTISFMGGMRFLNANSIPGGQCAVTVSLLNHGWSWTIPFTSSVAAAGWTKFVSPKFTATILTDTLTFSFSCPAAGNVDLAALVDDLRVNQYLPFTLWTQNFEDITVTSVWGNAAAFSPTVTWRFECDTMTLCGGFANLRGGDIRNNAGTVPWGTSYLFLETYRNSLNINTWSQAKVPITWTAGRYYFTFKWSVRQTSYTTAIADFSNFKITASSVNVGSSSAYYFVSNSSLAAYSAGWQTVKTPIFTAAQGTDTLQFFISTDMIDAGSGQYPDVMVLFDEFLVFRMPDYTTGL